jgi:membrane-associated protein
MSGILDPILHASPWVILTVVGLVVFAEDALFVGFVIPGETAAILGGVAAHSGSVPLYGVIIVVVVAAVVGDSVGYEVGRHLGPRVLTWRMLERRRARIDDARAYLARRGGMAVFLGRWTAFLRAVMPALAGMSHMPYPKFLAYNAAGGIIWGVGVVVAGYLVGASYARLEQLLSEGGAIFAVVLIALAVVVYQVRKRRSETERPSDRS